MSSKEYEAALLERLTWQFPPPLFRVEGTRDGKIHSRRGRSGELRQLDVAVYRDDELVFVADAKAHDTRPLAIAYVDGIVGVLDDVGCKLGLLASPEGFTSGAHARARASQIELLLMTYDEALAAELLPVARRIYPYDWAYHPQLAAAVLAVQQTRSWDEIADELHDVPFEEWERFALYAIAEHPDEARGFLQAVALNHHDDGWRFNAARILIEGGSMKESIRAALMKREAGDADFMELLAH